MNLQETRWDVSTKLDIGCPGWGGPVLNFPCSKENKKDLRILPRHEMEKLHTPVSEEGREALRR